MEAGAVVPPQLRIADVATDLLLGKLPPHLPKPLELTPARCPILSAAPSSKERVAHKSAGQCCPNKKGACSYATRKCLRLTNKCRRDVCRVRRSTAAGSCTRACRSGPVPRLFDSPNRRDSARYQSLPLSDRRVDSPSDWKASNHDESRARDCARNRARHKVDSSRQRSRPAQRPSAFSELANLIAFRHRYIPLKCSRSVRRV